MDKKALLLAIAIIICFSETALAQIPPSIMQNQNRIQQEQQRLIEQEFRQKQLQNALKRPQSQVEEKSSLPEPSSLVESCVNIKEVKVDGNTKVSKSQIKKITKKYTDKCLNLESINNLLQEITDAYINKGFITSRAFLTMPQTKIKQGILEIKVVEGKLSKIEGMKEGELFTAFPLMINKVLNLRDVEQGMDQINRLPSNHATMEIKADDKNEASKIEIKNQPQGRSFFTLFADNAGSESTGETRFGFRASQDNLLGINDQFNMSYAKSPSHDYDNRDANYFTLGAAIPYGYWTLNNNFSWSDYRTSFMLTSGDRFYSYGNSIINRTSLDRLLSRGQSYKLSATAGISYKRNQNYSRVIDLKTKNEVSSRDLSILDFGLNSTIYLPSGVIFVSPSFNQGIKAFGALKDENNDYSQKAQYQAWKLYSYYSQQVTDSSTYTATFDGQYSQDELYGTEAMYIGGEYSVRGFKNEGVQGDSGFSLRNDLNFNLAKLIRSDNQFAQGVNFGPFIDYGYVSSNNSNIKSETLSGTGAKVAFNYGYFESSVTYAKPIQKPTWFEENESWYLYGGFNIRF